MGGFFLFFIVIAVIVTFVVKHQKRVNEAWMDAASKLRLTYGNSGGGSRKIHGDRVDLSLTIRPKTVGKSTYTEYVAEYQESIPFTFRLKPQSAFSEVANVVLNRVDIETGDYHFDGKVIVESENAELIRDILTAEVRHAVSSVLDRFDSFEVTEHNLTVQRNRVVSDVSKLIDDIRTLESVARSVFRAASPEHDEEVEIPPSRIPPPLPAKEAEITTSEDEIDNSDTESNPETENSSSEVPVTVSSPILDITSENEHEDTEDAQESPFEIDPEVTHEPASEESPLDDDFAILCLDTFQECSGRYEFQKLFNAELKGREVEGTARMNHVESFSMDRVFGRGPGLRRTFTVGKMENGEELLLVANSPCEASLSELRSKEGGASTFVGTLVACDPFENTIYLRVPGTAEVEHSDPCVST